MARPLQSQQAVRTGVITWRGVRGLLLVGVCCAVGCTEPLIDGTFTQDEWDYAQSFRFELLTPPECDGCTSAEAGHRLFFDPRLSGAITAEGEGALGAIGESGKVSCSSCHDPSYWFVDRRSKPNASSLGTGWTKRNTISPVNTAYLSAFTWDGGYPTLEAVVELPIKSGAAMHSSRAIVADVVRTHYSGLVAYFGSTSGSDDELYTRAARSLAAYQAELRTGLAPLDRYLAGDLTAISDEAKRGLQVFIGRGLCSECHNGPLFTDQQFHNTGVAQRGVHSPATDLGRAGITAEIDDAGAFRTPMLRQVAETGPYMHTGELATLADVIDFYRWGGTPSGFSGTKDQRLVPLEIDDDDARALDAFLRTLTGEPIPTALTTRPILP